MNRTSLVLDENLSNLIIELKKRYVTNSTAYLVRLALTRLYENFLPQNVDVSTRVNMECTKLSIPRLPGMTDRVIRSQMDRFNLTTEEYETIVRHVVDNFAASGGQIKNAEAVIFGACRRYAKERDAQKKVQHSSEQPPEPATENPYELQDRLG